MQDGIHVDSGPDEFGFAATLGYEGSVGSQFNIFTRPYVAFDARFLTDFISEHVFPRFTFCRRMDRGNDSTLGDAYDSAAIVKAGMAGFVLLF